MGGIRAGQSRNFDLSTLSLPGRNGSFLIRAASIEQYNRRNARVTEDDVVYTGLVVYNLNDPTDRWNINVFAGIADVGEEYIWVQNTSNFVLELRVDTPNGEKLATLAPLQPPTAIPLKQQLRNMPYSFYATYVYIDPSTNEIKSLMDRRMEDRLVRTPSRERVNPMVFGGPSDTSSISYLVGFLRIKNDTNTGFILRDGTTYQFCQKGFPHVESGMQVTYELPSASLTREVGQPYTNLVLLLDNMREIRIDRLDVKPGVVYDLQLFMRDGNIVYDVVPTEFRDRLEDLRVNLFLGG